MGSGQTHSLQTEAAKQVLLFDATVAVAEIEESAFGLVMQGLGR